ncbi:thioredoxin family protein [Chitinophaga vietnamensis]|uniref:thioredoxin family protein n=1 Tax=Chitinophaga vietnamensis TaxID=2593957 RepID=UPI001375D10F|nr:thioredoxin family protein [Chitinophaga vietnamensis]
MKHTIKALLIAALWPLAASAQDSTQFIKGSWADLTAKARKEHKPIFIDTYFEGCHACKDMELRVFPAPEVKKYMQDNFICTGYDVFKEAFGKDLCIKYFVRGFPTYLVISGEGELIGASSGYSDADIFLSLLRENVQRYKAGTYLSGFGREWKGDEPAFYKAMYDKVSQPTDPAEVTAYLAKQKDKLAENTFKAMLAAGALPADYRTFYIKNRAAYLQRFGVELNRNILEKLLREDMKALPQSYDAAAFESFLQQQQRIYDAGSWQEIQMFYAENYLFKKCKNAKAFLEFAIAHHDNNENRVRYMLFYMGMEMQQDPALQALYIQWAKPVLSEHASLELLQSMAYLCKNNDKEAARQYFKWAIAKSTMMRMDAAHMQQELNKL